jgi:hypothetical protein
VLVSFDGKPAPDWGTRLNLNAFLALLSTILRALLVVIVSQIICQQKWEWYSNYRSQPLSDLQQFDSGSRGSLSALLLIPIVVLKDAVTLLAAAVLVLSFLVGPFVQQASRTTLCLFPAPDARASLPYANFIPRRDNLTLGGVGRVQGLYGDASIPGSAVAILSSVTAPNGTENQIHGDCSTGTCTFHNSAPGETFGHTVDDDPSTLTTVAMCEKCINVASLVSRTYISRNSSSNAPSAMLRLPNGLNFTYSATPDVISRIKPSPSLTWLGDLLTPELRAMSRWAYVNATFLAVSATKSPLDNTTELKDAVTAALCVLYPCLRTYTALITNNELFEKELSSQVMEIGVQLKDKVVSSPTKNFETSSASTITRWGTTSARGQNQAHYAAVKSPCYVNDLVYDETINTTITADTTSLSLYDYTDPHQIKYRNVSAPESCIYRHDVTFVSGISNFLNQEIFDGSCSWAKGIYCGKASQDIGPLSNLGVQKVLEKFMEGERGYSNVTLWFSAFANAMTNRFRTQYGGAAFNASLALSEDQHLPAGNARGVAWQTETCVSIHRAWLALPIGLTAITTVLLLWVIANNWRHRRTKPIWKDNILPLLFYRHKIEPATPGALPWQRENSTEVDVAEVEDETHAMETGEMEEISKRLPVTFRWPTRERLDNFLDTADSSAIALHDMRSPPTQRSSHDVDSESFLVNDETQHHQARTASRMSR